jgi:hypothetical protein
MLPKSKIANAAGPRNNYIQVYRVSDSDANAIGEVLPQYTKLCDRFVSAKITGGTEFLAAMQQQPKLTCILELPYDSVTKTIRSRDQIRDEGRIQHIDRATNQGENNEKIVLWIIEAVAT